MYHVILWLRVRYSSNPALSLYVLCILKLFLYLIRLVESALFDPGEPLSDADKERRKELALEHFQNYLRPFIQPLAGRNNYEDGIQFVFDALQDPVLNKQLTYILLDVILEELFPETIMPNIKRA